ncbi:ABC transporter substrate binding protein [Mesorhizobium mediterraneum]|uniref:ABC transporter substrate binding protein n=1 Tax=Mesorhizobium mediterraneum TaxID=43617 RepID=UPI001783346F
MKSIARRLLTLAVFFVLTTVASAADRKQILGIFYEGCENVCEGFKAAIKKSGFAADVTIIDLAQDKSRIPTAIAKARAMPADLVLTYGTNGTLGVIGTLDDTANPAFITEIPVVFVKVADPFGTHIAKGFEGSGRANVAGTFNRVPEAINIEIVRQYDPTFDKLGLLYNSNERNSAITAEELKKIAPTLGIELVALEIDPGNDSVPDIARIAERMAELREQGVRWLYVGSSSFLNANGELFTKTAVENGIAIVSPYEPLVREHHAMLSIAARLENVGHLAAEQALSILRDGATPGNLPIVRATDFAYVVNMEVAKKLDRYPPFAFLQVAEAVNN